MNINSLNLTPAQKEQMIRELQVSMNQSPPQVRQSRPLVTIPADRIEYPSLRQIEAIDESEQIEQIEHVQHGIVQQQELVSQPIPQPVIATQQPIDKDPPVLRFPNMDRDLAEAFGYSVTTGGMNRNTPENILLIQVLRDMMLIVDKINNIEESLELTLAPEFENDGLELISHKPIHPLPVTPTTLKFQKVSEMKAKKSNGKETIPADKSGKDEKPKQVSSNRRKSAKPRNTAKKQR